MNDRYAYDPTVSKRAFQRGMILALAVAFVPVAFVSTGLFLSGYRVTDFSPSMRSVLIGAWLVYVFTADRIAGLKFWLKIPYLRSANIGELVTIVAFAALVASLREYSGPRDTLMVIGWLKSFVLFLMLFGGLYGIGIAVSRSWKRAKARTRLKRGASLSAVS